MSVLAVVDAAEVTAIAAEVFAALIDGHSGTLAPWPGGSATLGDPLHAWVDLETEPVSRVQLSTDAGTAGDLTRALLRMDAVQPVAEADVADALGEIANVLSGNIKALLPEHVGVTLPEVSRRSPWHGGAVLFHEISLSWCARPLVISLWTL